METEKLLKIAEEIPGFREFLEQRMRRISVGDSRKLEAIEIIKGLGVYGFVDNELFSRYIARIGLYQKGNYAEKFWGMDSTFPNLRIQKVCPITVHSTQGEFGYYRDIEPMGFWPKDFKKF